MIYSICYVGSLTLLLYIGTSFSKCITERMMRNEVVMQNIRPQATNLNKWKRDDKLDDHRV